MLSEKENNKSPTFRQMFTSLAQGTFNGVFTRWAFWPIEKTFYDYSDPSNAKTYAEFFRNNLKFKNLYHLQTTCFKDAGFGQAFWKAFANMGVIAVIEHRYSHLNPLQKGVTVAMWSAHLETLLTTPGEMNKVRHFKSEDPEKVEKFKVFNIKNIQSPEFKRCVLVTYFRSVWSSIFTYGGIYGTEHVLKQYYPDKKHNTHVKVMSALVGSAIAQPAVMPIVNFQTLVMNQPRLPLKTSVGTFFNAYRLSEIAKGAKGRGVHRMLMYSSGFFLNEMMKEDPENSSNDQKISSPSPCKTK